MKEFDEQKTAFIPYPLRPFFFYSLREKYLKVELNAAGTDNQKIGIILVGHGQPLEWDKKFLFFYHYRL